MSASRSSNPKVPIFLAFFHSPGATKRNHDNGDVNDLPSPYPCFMTTEHMKTSMGRISFNGTLPLPVVWIKPRAERSSSSETAPGASILLPRIKKGTRSNCWIARRACFCFVLELRDHVFLRICCVFHMEINQELKSEVRKGTHATGII